MKTSQVVVGVALVAQSNAFFAPGVGTKALARTARAAVTPFRMQADNSAGDNVRRAADNVKEAGKNALNKAENAADNVANKLDENTSKSGSNFSSSSSSSTTTNVAGGADVIRAKEVVGKEVIKEAPLTAVHVHEQETIVDKTKIEEERIKTEVIQKVQPIRDEERRAEQVKTVDHGTEVRVQGEAGIDAATQAELERRRKELEATVQNTKDVSRKEVSMRPDVVVNEQTKVIEQVVPVIDKEVFIPKREEHEKTIVNVINEKPKIVGTQVEQTITKEEFEKQYGTKLDVKTAGTTAGTTAVNTSSSVRTETSGSGAAAHTADIAANTSAAGTNKFATSDSQTTKTTGSSVVGGGSSPIGGSSGIVDDSAAAKSTYISEDQKARQAAAGTEEAVPYSMSSTNMIRDAEEAGEVEESGPGLGAKIKNAIKSIVD